MDGHLPGINRAPLGLPGAANIEGGGRGVSMEIDAAATLLIGMLSKRGTDATAKQLMKLIKLGQRWGHFADTPLPFSVSEWQELGEDNNGGGKGRKGDKRRPRALVNSITDLKSHEI